jgi:hypothetical protein
MIAQHRTGSHRIAQDRTTLIACAHVGKRAFHHTIYECATDMEMDEFDVGVDCRAVGRITAGRDRGALHECATQNETNHLLCNGIKDIAMDLRPTMKKCMSLQGLAAPLALLCAVATALPVPAAAQTADDFYRGKTITIIVPIGPGGAYDAYARILARHLGRHIPGTPAIIARNMPGGGGVIASNHMYNVAPQDGTTLAIIISSFANDQLFDNPQIKYDARGFLAIGRLVDAT